MIRPRSTLAVRFEGFRAPAGNPAPMRPFDDITRIERAQVLDKPVAAVRAVVTRVLRNRTVKDALHGVWLGHPLHPGAAQFTAGSLLSASMLDAVGGPVGGGRLPSSFLIAAGLATAPVTAAAGWADWSESHEDQMRVGLVHAATNVVALSLYGAALVQRARGGRRPAAVPGRRCGGGRRRAARRPPGLPAGDRGQPRRGDRAHRAGGLAVARPAGGGARRQAGAARGR